MNYSKIYNNLVEKAKSENRVKGEGVYYEAHHIVPRCLGGSDDVDNLVNLTAKEHFIAHKLLCEIYPGNNKLVYAYWCMVSFNNTNRNYIIGSREFDRIRQEYSKIHSENISGKNNVMYGIKRPKHGDFIKSMWDNGVYGKRANQKKCKKCGINISKDATLCIKHVDKSGKNNGMYGKTNYDIWLEKYGENIADKKWKEQQSKAANSRKGLLAGENNPMYGKTGEKNSFYGKTHTEEVKNKLSKKAKERTGLNGQRTKIIIDIETGVFYTADELSDLYNVSSSYIRRMINKKSFKNYKFVI